MRSSIRRNAKIFFESSFADSVAIYLLSLALDFDYAGLREREYPLLTPNALAARTAWSVNSTHPTQATTSPCAIGVERSCFLSLRTLRSRLCFYRTAAMLARNSFSKSPLTLASFAAASTAFCAAGRA